MMSLPDLAAVLRRAAGHGAKVVVTGDPMQMQAVEGGGGMDMLARRLGHVQLSEAWRFVHRGNARPRCACGTGIRRCWPSTGSMTGCTPGAPTHLDTAARAYLHDRLSGKDTLLICATDAMAAELSRRVRDDLIRWGTVSDGPPSPWTATRPAPGTGSWPARTTTGSTAGTGGSWPTATCSGSWTPTRTVPGFGC